MGSEDEIYIYISLYIYIRTTFYSVKPPFFRLVLRVRGGKGRGERVSSLCRAIYLNFFFFFAFPLFESV